MMKIAKFFKENYLLGVVFITGACVLIIEIAATRILSPFFGNTIYSVSSILSIILAALSFGYYYGGRLADKRPSEKLFFLIIALSGIATSAIRFLSDIFIPSIAWNIGFKSGSLVASLVLFFIPAFLLGILSPFVIRLLAQKTAKSKIGAMSGKVFFVSTFGSIFGSLSAGFYLIPSFGLTQIILGTGVTLTALGLLGLTFSKVRISRLSIFVLILTTFYLLGISSSQITSPGVIYSKDGVYQKIVVRESEEKGEKIRYLHLDLSNSAAINLDSERLVFGYSKYYSLYKLFNPNPERVLVVGGGGYVIPSVYLNELPNASVDAVEIEPGLYELSKQYFNLEEDPRLTNYIVDGRRFLVDTDHVYDVIFLDAYSEASTIPEHMATKEFFELVQSKLTSEGIVIANVIGDLAKVNDSLTYSEMKTLLSVFPNSYFFAIDSPNRLQAQNMIFLGINSDKKIDFSELSVYEDETIRALALQQIKVEESDLATQAILTDNYAPIEKLVAGFIDRLGWK